MSDFCPDADVRAYRDCLALYGAVLAQATENLNRDLRTLEALQGSDVHGIGYADFESLARSALDGALETGPQNSTVKSLLSRIRTDPAECRFQGSREQVACGSSRIVLSTSPELAYAGIRFYAPGSYAGISGTYQVSAAWSYRDALERMKSTSQYARLAQEASEYAEELESKGKAREAVLVRKQAFDAARDTTARAGISPFTP